MVPRQTGSFQPIHTLRVRSVPYLGEQLGLCSGDDRGIAVLIADEMTIHIEGGLDAGMPEASSQPLQVDVLLDPSRSGGMPERMEKPLPSDRALAHFTPA